MARPTMISVLALICLGSTQVHGQVIFHNDFESGNTCPWSNADHTDTDGDGWAICADDCNDGDGDINPGAEDVCGDAVDSDCTGFADESCCHPLLQDCSGTEACFYNIFNNSFACATPFGDPPGGQEDPCQFINACAEGFGCTLCIPPNCDTEDLVCARYCDPDGSGCSSGESCLYYDQFWGDVDPAPEDFGMCVPDEIIP